MSHDLVVFGEDWGSHPSSTQHLVRRLGTDRDVIWVNSIGLRRPRVNRRDLGRAVAKLKALASPGARTVGNMGGQPSGLSVVQPRAVSWPGSRIAESVNRLFLGHQLRHALAQRRMTRPVFWTSLPSAAPIIGEINERAVVYYCGDDFSSLAGVDHDAVVAMERKLVARADLILAASELIAGRFPAKRTVLTPHGVDLDLFTRPAVRASDLPEGHPIVGFYGSIAEWIDVDMLANAARALPAWRFVLVGEVRTDVTDLAALPNVCLLGPRPHESLPCYSQHWDVSVLPFRDTRQIRACNPLKLREYFAAGPPVATTEFPAIAAYRDFVSVARDRDDFAGAILRAATQSSSKPLRRQRVASESWDERAREVAALIDAL